MRSIVAAFIRRLGPWLPNQVILHMQEGLQLSETQFKRVEEHTVHTHEIDQRFNFFRRI